MVYTHRDGVLMPDTKYLDFEKVMGIPVFTKPCVVDVDDTLVLWNKSDYPDDEQIEVNLTGKPGHQTFLIPHQKNINMFIKFAKMGYDMIVWSKTGYDWAKLIVEALELQPYVSAIASKPNFYFDDREASDWIGERVYREPNSDYTGGKK